MIKLRAVRSLLEESKESDLVESRGEFVRRIVRHPSELRAERSLLGEL